MELPEAVGLRRARQMSATGNFIDAATALTWGLVNQVVPHEDLLDVSVALGADIASSDQATLRALLAGYAEGALGTRAQALERESRAHGQQHRDGIDAPQVRRRRDAIIGRGRAQA